MSDSGKIIIGIIIFVGIFTFPFWFNRGKASPPPKLVVGTQEKQCVESKEFMKSSHMLLLNTWRDKVVRDGDHVYVSSTYPGKKFEMSLQRTCTGCHAKKAEFCDRCHNYVEATPNCWNCHVEPKEPGKQAARSDK